MLQSDETLTSIVDASPVGVIILDDRGLQLCLNRLAGAEDWPAIDRLSGEVDARLSELIAYLDR